MLPYLFEFHWGAELVRIPAYGVMLAIAFSAAYFDSLRRAVRTGYDTRVVENLFLIVIFCSVVGARGFHVLFEDFAFYRKNPSHIFRLWEGGYTFYGALLLAALGIFLYCRWKRVPFLPYGDIAAPATGLGLFFGRLGCFFAGCCWGVPTDSFLGVRFNHPDTFAAIRGVKVHPTQVYESLLGLCIFLGLSWYFRRTGDEPRRQKLAQRLKFNPRRVPGEVFFVGVVVYGLGRFLIEFFRGDEYRGFSAGVSYSQWVSLTLVPLALWGYVWVRRQTPGAKGGRP